jgi:hypothetical protein
MKTALVSALLFLCSLASAQQTTVGLQFFDADYNNLQNYPGVDGASRPAIAKGLRLWDSGVKWCQVETARATYNWTKLDDFVNRAIAAHQDVLYTVGCTPQWASSATEIPGVCFSGDGWSCTVPKEEDFKEFITTMVTRYKGKIAFWEPWNEPEAKGFFNGTVAQLQVMVKDAAKIIRENDPAATIISPSFHGPNMATYFHDFMQGQTRSLLFDVVNAHLRGQPNYPPENFLKVWNVLVTQMDKDKVDAPIWDDEHGITSKDNMTDPDQLAAIAARELLVRASVPLQRQYIYFWDAHDPWSFNKTLTGTAWNTVAGWLMDKPTSKTRVNGTIYYMQVGNGVVIWDTSKTCSQGCCAEAAYPLGETKFRTQTDITGSTTEIVNQSVMVGAKPIFLQ